MSNTFNINGTVITGRNSMTIINGKVYLDGTDVTPDSKEINITIEGNVEELKVDACSSIKVIGHVSKLKTSSGYVTSGSAGDISTSSGDVEVDGEVKGDVTTMSGNVSVNGLIYGSVKTMSGNVKCK